MKNIFGPAKPLVERCASDKKIDQAQCAYQINLLALGLFAGGHPKDGCGASGNKDEWRSESLPALVKWIGSHPELEAKSQMDALEAALKALYPCSAPSKE